MGYTMMIIYLLNSDTYNAGRRMEEYNIANIAGIEEDDGTVICRNCMDEGQWANLKENQIISVDKIEKGEKLYFCDYCEERL